MSYFKWTVYGLLVLLVGAFLHYTLPQHDIVRITDTYEKRENPGENWLFWAQADSGTDPLAPRDVFFVQTQTPDNDVIVYRNEDTAWGWPPYFKFNTSNVQAEAADLRSTADAPRWAIIKHYGWRVTWYSIYPNAISVHPATGPDQRIIPWVNIIILTVLAALFWAIRVRWVRFWDRKVDPVLDSVGERIDGGADRVRGMFGRK